MKITSAYSVLSEAQQRRLLRHMAAVRDNWESVNWIKTGLAHDDSGMVREAWGELDTETQIALWVAPKYGGVWTTEEREKIRGMGSE